MVHPVGHDRVYPRGQLRVESVAEFQCETASTRRLIFV